MQQKGSIVQCYCPNCQFPPPSTLEEYRCYLEWCPVEEENGFTSSVNEHNQVNGIIYMQASPGGGLYGEAPTFLHKRMCPPLVSGTPYSFHVTGCNMNTAFKGRALFTCYVPPDEMTRLLKTESDVVTLVGGCVRFPRQRPLSLSLSVQRKNGRATISSVRLHVTEEDFREFAEYVSF
jgi:hypothetical protein